MQSQDISRIDLMSRAKRVADSQSSQDVELTETNAVSPDLMAREDGPSEVLPSQSAWKCYWKRCTFLIMLVICSAVLGFEINAQQGADVIVHGQSFSYPDDFSFLVFCPYSYYNKETSFKRKQAESDDELRRRLLYKTYSYELKVGSNDQNFNANRTYVVEAQSHNFTFFNNETGRPDVRPELFYCGLVRDFYSTCNNSYMACSSPGPMFDIPARESVDVIWVNKLDSQIRPNVVDSCMNKTKYPNGSPFCQLRSKLNRTQTFLDPTNLTHTTSPLQNMEIKFQSWPITMHLHGAEIRPTFDGNPLSWIDNNPYSSGRVGVATFSLDESCYYDSFDKIKGGDNYNPPNIKLIGEVGSSNYKINRYPNRQNPGNLWYHDHAMHLTDYNVRYGLAGFYILRDEIVQKKIGINRKNEKLVLITGLGFTNLKPSFPLSGFVPGEAYRFRFLNNNYDDGDLSMIRISFSYNNCQDKLKYRENFTIIGADSSLFNTSIDNQQSFVITQAERMEILIIFEERKSFSICANEYFEDPNSIGNATNGIKSNIVQNSPHSTRKQGVHASSYSIKGITLEKRDPNYISLNTNNKITNLTLGVPFTDLRKQTKIDVRRMRPLIWVGHKTFTINGRTDFHKGLSENPVVGSTEDWFLINTIFFPHPIHVHLINFQVIKQYDLRVIIPSNNPDNDSSLNCALYELDFIAMALKTANKSDTNVSYYNDKVFKKNIIDYDYLCQNVKFIGRVPAVQVQLNTIYPENDTDSKAKGLNGMDLFLRAKAEDLSKLSFTVPIKQKTGEIYKYIVDDGHTLDDTKPYYARWKDTAFVEEFKALQYRIRWTKSDFTAEDRKKGTFFNVPNDQLREFPGYVYHCHILRHEDDEMMRPIMMQLPQGAELDINLPCNRNSTTGQPILKWSDKYNCINAACHNNKTVKSP